MAWIERYWQKVTPLAVLLYPLSLAFRMAVAARRALYRSGLLHSTRLPVPVIVIGNISAGGTGKTPLVLWMAKFLAGRGLRPGIVSRGYGGRSSETQAVQPDSDPALVGDEPVMLARRGAGPVWVGSDRVAAAKALLAAHPACDVIVCDDGLQHYRLARDMEVAVIDGARGFGNGWMHPAGPLREPQARLASVSAVVINGGRPAGMLLSAPAIFEMTLRGEHFRNLLDPARGVGADHFKGRNVHAVAGIGHPRRFFARLTQLGLDVTSHAFPDHHPYTAADLAPCDGHDVVMTEKDAVKCRSFANARWWTLTVDADVDSAFGDAVLHGIEKRS
jgi:tetraacyldisaccharide 4'-kinase